MIVCLHKTSDFNINTYLSNVIANLVDLGNETEGWTSAKRRMYEKGVCEVFKQLGFAVQPLRQVIAKESDLIAIHKEKNVVFIVY